MFVKFLSSLLYEYLLDIEYCFGSFLVRANDASQKRFTEFELSHIMKNAFLAFYRNKNCAIIWLMLPSICCKIKLLLIDYLREVFLSNSSWFGAYKFDNQSLSLTKFKRK
jgi:hypothetical protein